MVPPKQIIGLVITRAYVYENLVIIIFIYFRTVKVCLVKINNVTSTYDILLTAISTNILGGVSKFF